MVWNWYTAGQPPNGFGVYSTFRLLQLVTRSADHWKGAGHVAADRVYSWLRPTGATARGGLRPHNGPRWVHEVVFWCLCWRWRSGWCCVVWRQVSSRGSTVDSEREMTSRQPSPGEPRGVPRWCLSLEQMEEQWLSTKPCPALRVIALAQHPVWVA